MKNINIQLSPLNKLNDTFLFSIKYKKETGISTKLLKSHFQRRIRRRTNPKKN